ncbi:uncharacterized protein LOC129330372 [Eublepharis macularius]|uniref:Uncharacterized protein LOC129330372 n=1 Tax=Eublepharis macularius TaxID=481883 RepID=A0AA97JDQ1_EUBMA|nr:uncharacterized protein LOC129330372 [Eublepharis macularius]
MPGGFCLWLRRLEPDGNSTVRLRQGLQKRYKAEVLNFGRPSRTLWHQHLRLSHIETCSQLLTRFLLLQDCRLVASPFPLRQGPSRLQKSWTFPALRERSRVYFSDVRGWQRQGDLARRIIGTCSWAEPVPFQPPSHRGPSWAWLPPPVGSPPPSRKKRSGSGRSPLPREGDGIEAGLRSFRSCSRGRWWVWPACGCSCEAAGGTRLDSEHAHHFRAVGGSGRAPLGRLGLSRRGGAAGSGIARGGKGAAAGREGPAPGPPQRRLLRLSGALLRDVRPGRGWTPTELGSPFARRGALSGGQHQQDNPGGSPASGSRRLLPGYSALLTARPARLSRASKPSGS